MINTSKLPVYLGELTKSQEEALREGLKDRVGRILDCFVNKSKIANLGNTFTRPAVDVSYWHHDFDKADDFRLICSIAANYEQTVPTSGTLLLQMSDITPYFHPATRYRLHGLPDLPTLRDQEAISALSDNPDFDCIVALPLGHVVSLTEKTWHSSPAGGLANRIVCTADGRI